MSEIEKLNAEFEKRGKRDGSKKQEINNQYDHSYKNLRTYLQDENITAAKIKILNCGVLLFK